MPNYVQAYIRELEEIKSEYCRLEPEWWEIQEEIDELKAEAELNFN